MCIQGKKRGGTMKKVFLQTGLAFVMIFLLVITASFARADSKYNYVSYSEMEALLKNLAQTSQSKPVNIFHLETFGYSFLGVPCMRLNCLRILKRMMKTSRMCFCATAYTVMNGCRLN